jgi:FkbM family methyltransferase
MFKKRFRRHVRYTGVAEYLCSRLRHGRRLRLPIGIDLDISPDDILIDCGANVGDVTTIFARTGAKVYAFEPQSVCFNILTRRFRMASKVTLINKGVMDRACLLDFSTPGPTTEWDALEATVAGSFLPEAMRDDYMVSKSSVECTDIDKFIRSVGRVRLMKLDIEGAEIAVLNKLMDSGTINLVDLIVAETHERQIPSLSAATGALRKRIDETGLSHKIRLDWY